jgi:hypothetical protein
MAEYPIDVTDMVDNLVRWTSMCTMGQMAAPLCGPGQTWWWGSSGQG